MADGEDKKSRGELARAAIGQIDVLPPDPLPPEKRRPFKPLTLPPTPGVLAHQQGRNPKAIRRRVLAKIRDLSDDAAETLGKLMEDGRDTRVQLQAVAIALSYTAGKPGENMGDGENIDGGGDLDISLLSEAEQDELQAALNTIARLRAVAVSRAK